MNGYPWYDCVEENKPLLQGDFINSCPIVVPPDIRENQKAEVDIIEYDIIIMSQSCDILNRKVNIILVCPIFPLKEFEEKSIFFKSRKGKESLRQGNIPGYHLLNECKIEGFKRDFFVVDFHNVYGIQIDYLLRLVKKVGKRLRLLPPYREHLSQAFARFFMRVGLPEDISPF